MEADTSLSIKGDGVAIAPDIFSNGLVVWASQSATLPMWEVIDIPLAPSQMLTVAAWLTDMAYQDNEEAEDTLTSRLKMAERALCQATDAINGAPLPHDPEFVKKWRALQSSLNRVHNARANIQFALRKHGKEWEW